MSSVVCFPTEIQRENRIAIQKEELTGARLCHGSHLFVRAAAASACAHSRAPKTGPERDCVVPRPVAAGWWRRIARKLGRHVEGGTAGICFVRAAAASALRT